MATNLPALNFQDHAVRAETDENGIIWFAATDICDILEIKTPQNAYSRLEDDEKDVRNIDTLRGKQRLVCVTESGAYGLILQSRKPQAKAFGKWLRSEVIPSIARTGNYISNPSEPQEVVAVARLKTGELRPVATMDQTRHLIGDVAHLAKMVDAIANPRTPDIAKLPSLTTLAEREAFLKAHKPDQIMRLYIQCRVALTMSEVCRTSSYYESNEGQELKNLRAEMDAVKRERDALKRELHGMKTQRGHVIAYLTGDKPDNSNQPLLPLLQA